MIGDSRRTGFLVSATILLAMGLLLITGCTGSPAERILHVNGSVGDNVTVVVERDSSDSKYTTKITYSTESGSKSKILPGSP